jgi:hypothetical protein
MNAQQRKFLIEKITEKTKLRIKALESQIPKDPDVEMLWLMQAIEGKLKLKPTEGILNYFHEKAKERVEKGSSQRNSWYDTDSSMWGAARNVYARIPISTLFESPDGLDKLKDDHRSKKDEIQAQIYELEKQLEMLEIRINLASDKTLQTMINEIDDMGNISLLDTKIKYLS